MKNLLLLICVFTCTSSFSQYYYNDIIANEQSNKRYQLLKSNKIKNITVNSYDAENQASQGFSLSQEFTPDYRKLITKSTTASGSVSLLTSFYENNKVKRSDEITKGVETKSEYVYNDKALLQSITSTSTDTALKSKSIEAHVWIYNEKGQPTLMLKIKNNTDTIRIEMVLDDHGNVIEEHWKRKTVSLENYYYYYNDKNQLTDIVRFNKRAQKLLPDFLFEYDAAGRLSQMIQVPAGSSNYTIWKYTYDDKGLKQEEICSDRQKQLMGKIVYSYQ